MAEETRGYVVRDAGKPSRPGKVWKTYPYTLDALLEALEDARLRSVAGPSTVIVRVIGSERITFRRFEQGKQVPPPR